ncbi:reverse transcriptase domain-containing protein [Ktedonospora formicarum]|uniref:Reverse transcriptase domain-containing protein n=1 Tax=Ktedonospora formicarum TaxID=2778364 RepID=A0A8J3MXY7_9CHLR|nr:reverse transcriptase domain-containing protein [Ktedonospora formicarum]GHO49100.1 hypothetical protein KSX_72630 [Ktedonospora formicarum]
MMTKNEYLIAQMKLQELRQQRTRLSQSYAELEQQVEHTPTKLQQLHTLFTGLQHIKMAEISLHPDVANLEPLLNGPQHSEETISFWHKHLTKELPQGRLRSELIYIFGALLEEWVQEKSQERTPDPAGVQTCAQFLELACESARPAPNLALLKELFAERNDTGRDIARWFQQFGGTLFQERITTSEVCSVLEHLSNSPMHTATTRKHAKDFLRDKVMCKEMAEALSLLLARFDEWDWPKEGVSAFPLWTMNKWRLFITYDLFTMCFLEVLGSRLHNAFQQFLATEQLEREKQLSELLKAPPHENEDVLFQQAMHHYRLANSDIWANSRPLPETPQTLKNLQSFFQIGHYYSIAKQRQHLRKNLQEASTTLDSYGDHQEIDGIGTALQYINAEIQLAQAAFPQAPLYVLKLDIKDFYPTLSHDLLLSILELYGFSPRQLAFFRKFLQVRVRKGEGQERFQQGVPLHHRFSNVLGEMVLHLLDQHIVRNARVQIIRLVDDICILTPEGEEITKAWQAAQEFCRETGLALNSEKCGAVCIGGNLPAQLPQSSPRWLQVKLNQDGTWEVDMEAFASYLEKARQQVLHYSSLLTQIEVYNLHVKHLIRATAMESDLGEAHRLSTIGAAAHFHKAFFQEHQGMIEALRQAIQERFLHQDSMLRLPEDWFYWPITAGGCGMTHAMIMASGYAESHSTIEQRTPPSKRPANWQQEYNDWLHFYTSFIKQIHLKEPVATKGMEILVNDFIHRSNEMGNSEQKTLGTYWRWILYIYGPQILDHLGTFRFLSTELVPLQIILQHYQYDLKSESNDSLDNLGDLEEHPF